MQFPESWLREFCNPALTTTQLADTLTMGGLEVEEIKPYAPAFTGVVVAEIMEVVQHPDADRLRICQVDVGQSDLLQIVCGAPNARIGIKIPCAMVGSELPPHPDGTPSLIRVGALRGVASQGMLCSARELMLSDDQAGLMELSADAPVGVNIRSYLRLDDSLLTLKLTPNLGHCLSVYGVARELSALTGAPLNKPCIQHVPPTSSDRLLVQVSAPDLCGRFSGRVVRNVDTTVATPAWMVDRLARCGQRSVTALVDISNYVMFEMGQPSHIFDLDKISNSLEVRWGRTGESLRLLDGSTIDVDEKVGVIADGSQVESLAGIMGGGLTAVTESTKNIYIESAFWWPEAIAGRSRRFNFSTDAGHRFERGVDPSMTSAYLERITGLVLEICGSPTTTVGPIDDILVCPPAPASVKLRLARASKVIGMSITMAQAVDALTRLELPLEIRDESIVVTPPSYRFDLKIEEDLIEEVARLIGYQNLPETAPSAPITARLCSEQSRTTFAIRRAVAARGYQETINFSFVDERWERDLAGNTAPIRLMNPIASHMSVMRTSLLGSLLQVLRFNLDRKSDQVRVFEIGRVFQRDATVHASDHAVEGLRQPMHIAALAYGPAERLQWGSAARNVDFFDVKGDIESLFAPTVVEFVPAEHPAMHPGRCAAILADGRTVGHLGELHPRWRQANDLPAAPVLFEVELAALSVRAQARFEPVSKQQGVDRDLAIVVDEKVTYEQVAEVVRSALDPSLLRDLTLFDIYRPSVFKGAIGSSTNSVGPNEKSLALRLTLGQLRATLTDAQIDAAVAGAVAALKQAVGARLRS